MLPKSIVGSGLLLLANSAIQDPKNQDVAVISPITYRGTAILQAEPDKRIGVKTFEIHTSQWIPRSLGEVHSFFADAFNLEIITPTWLKFQVETSKPIDMHAGTEIDYRLKIRGVPIRWRSRITVWEPPYRFVDEQVCGPYRLWVHEHKFHENNGGTLCEDHVRYAVWGGVLVQKLLVERDVKKIFIFRKERLQELFPDSAQTPPNLGEYWAYGQKTHAASR